MQIGIDARKFGGVVALAVAVTGLIGVAAGDWSSFDWTAAVGAATAYGTLALALVTWRLATSSSQDVGQTQRLAQLAEREQQALVRPFVRPWVFPDWGAPRNTLPLRNDGAGVALNVDPHVADARVTERSVALFQGAGDERVLDGAADPTHQPTARLKC